MHYLSERRLPSNPLSCHDEHPSKAPIDFPKREKEREREKYTVASLKPRHKKQADGEFAFEESWPSFRHDATSPDLTSISMTMKYRNVPAAGISMKYLWRYSLVTGRMKMSGNRVIRRLTRHSVKYKELSFIATFSVAENLMFYLLTWRLRWERIWSLVRMEME